MFSFVNNNNNNKKTPSSDYTVGDRTDIMLSFAIALLIYFYWLQL